MTADRPSTTAAGRIRIHATPTASGTVATVHPAAVFPLTVRRDQRTIARAHRRIARMLSRDQDFSWLDFERVADNRRYELDRCVRHLGERIGEPAAEQLWARRLRRSYLPSRLARLAAISCAAAAIGGTVDATAALVVVLALPTFGTMWTRIQLHRIFIAADQLAGGFRSGELRRALRRNRDTVPVDAFGDPSTRDAALAAFGLSDQAAATAVSLSGEYVGSAAELACAARLLER